MEGRAREQHRIDISFQAGLTTTSANPMRSPELKGLSALSCAGPGEGHSLGEGGSLRSTGHRQQQQQLSFPEVGHGQVHHYKHVPTK